MKVQYIEHKSTKKFCISYMNVEELRIECKKKNENKQKTVNKKGEKRHVI